MCEAGREEPFDELSAWIFSPTLTRHSHLMGSQLGFLSDADPAHHLPGDLRTIADLSENVQFRQFLVEVTGLSDERKLNRGPKR